MSRFFPSAVQTETPAPAGSREKRQAVSILPSGENAIVWYFALTFSITRGFVVPSTFQSFNGPLYSEPMASQLLSGEKASAPAGVDSRTVVGTGSVASTFD